METERIALSQRERDRLKVLHDVQQKQLTQVAAAERLKVTDRHVRRMLLRLREQGDAALVRGGTAFGNLRVQQKRNVLVRD
jgi:Mn-dependent DtxR family transcriptional regulator